MRNVIGSRIMKLVSIAVGILLVSWLGIAHATRPELRPTLGFLVAAVAVVAAIVGAVIGAATLASSQRQIRRSRSLDLLARLQTLETIRLACAVEDFCDRHSEHALAEAISGDSAIHNNVEYLLSLYEDIAISIRWELSDEWILYDSLGYDIPHNVDLLEPYIGWIRNETGDAEIYVRAENLANRWRKGLSGRNGARLSQPGI